MVNPFDRREMDNAVKLARAVGEKLMFPAFIKARPTYKHSAEQHHPVWRETGSGAKAAADELRPILAEIVRRMDEIGRASCRERVCQYVSISVVAESLKTNNRTKNNLQPIRNQNTETRKTS